MIPAAQARRHIARLARHYRLPAAGAQSDEHAGGDLGVKAAVKDLAVATAIMADETGALITLALGKVIRGLR